MLIPLPKSLLILRSTVKEGLINLMRKESVKTA